VGGIYNRCLFSSNLVDHIGILSFSQITRRFSQGKLRWWPDTPDTLLHPMQAHQLSVLLYNGLPEQAQFAPAWRMLPQTIAQAALAIDSSPR